MINKISTDKAPSAIGAYSQAVVCGGLVFTSGQIPINPESGIIEAEGIREQTEQVTVSFLDVNVPWARHLGQRKIRLSKPSASFLPR